MVSINSTKIDNPSEEATNDGIETFRLVKTSIASLLLGIAILMLGEVISGDKLSYGDKLIFSLILLILSVIAPFAYEFSRLYLLRSHIAQKSAEKLRSTVNDQSGVIVNQLTSHVDKQILDLKSSVDSALGGLPRTIEYQGTLGKLLENPNNRLIELASRATEIRNTLIVNDLKKINILRFINGNTSPRRINYIESALSKKCHWVDLYSKSILRHVNPQIKQLSDKYNKEKYSAWVLKKNQHSINLVLFRGENGFREAWFGFGLIDGKDGPVYSTKEAALIEYFESYFEALIDESRPWLQESPETITGIWLSVSYDSDGSKIQDIAVINITSDEDENFSIRGSIYDLRSNRVQRKIRVFSTISARMIVDGNNPIIHFSHQDEHPEKYRSDTRKYYSDIPWGAGRYQFLNSHTEYVGDVFAVGETLLKIYGRKLSKEFSTQLEISGEGARVDLLNEILTENAISAEAPSYGKSPFRTSKYFSRIRN